MKLTTAKSLTIIYFIEFRLSPNNENVSQYTVSQSPKNNCKEIFDLLTQNENFEKFAGLKLYYFNF